MQTLYFYPVISSSSFFFFSSPNLSGHRVDVYHNSTWCGLSANLECRSEMCSTWLAGNTGCKNDAKKINICGPLHKFVWLYLRNEGVYCQLENTC